PSARKRLRATRWSHGSLSRGGGGRRRLGFRPWLSVVWLPPYPGVQSNLRIVRTGSLWRRVPHLSVGHLVQLTDSLLRVNSELAQLRIQRETRQQRAHARAHRGANAVVETELSLAHFARRTPGGLRLRQYTMHEFRY